VILLFPSGFEGFFFLLVATIVKHSSFPFQEPSPGLPRAPELVTYVLDSPRPLLVRDEFSTPLPFSSKPFRSSCGSFGSVVRRSRSSL